LNRQLVIQQRSSGSLNSLPVI